MFHAVCTGCVDTSETGYSMYSGRRSELRLCISGKYNRSNAADLLSRQLAQIAHRFFNKTINQSSYPKLIFK